MSHIFISYSRKDLAVAQKIVNALAADNLDTWVDWKSIPKGEEWLEEIFRGIEEADVFLFLISPDSVISEYCNQEIVHAVKNGKRILPIVLRDAKTNEFLDETAKNEISSRNWIFCRDGQDDFNKAIEETQKTIHTDYEWLKYHTELQVKALKWEQKKDASRLLRGMDLAEAEEKLANAGSKKDPQPTMLQRDYVNSSALLRDSEIQLEQNHQLLSNTLIEWGNLKHKLEEIKILYEPFQSEIQRSEISGRITSVKLLDRLWYPIEYAFNELMEFAKKIEHIGKKFEINPDRSMSGEPWALELYSLKLDINDCIVKGKSKSTTRNLIGYFFPQAEAMPAWFAGLAELTNQFDHVLNVHIYKADKHQRSLAVELSSLVEERNNF